MDARYINAFISDVAEIFSMLAPNVQLTRQPPCVKQSPAVVNSIVTVIGVTGDVRGQVVFTFQMGWGLQLAGQMCCGTTFPDVNPLAISALGEIANMLSARAITNIGKLTGKVADITPPTSLHSTGVMNVQIAPPFVCIPYKSGTDTVFEISFALN